MYQEDNPALVGRCVIWPAGVDIEYWKPEEDQTRETILIYEKQRKGPVGPIEPYLEWIEEQGYKVELIKCGEYELDDFRVALQRAHLMVGFVIDESQGLAWAEAWSVDVPTLIWRNTSNLIRGRIIETSTAPFLSDETGLFFNDFNDFKTVFSFWGKSKTSFHPRKWVLNNMSDESCAILLCKLAGIGIPE
jgi:hypothetical protein